MKRYLCLLLVLVIALLCACARTAAEADVLVEMVALNVGKADAILVRVEEKRYLIDTGTKGSYDRMYAALKELGATSLDGVILTHTDKDHGGGMKKLSESDMEIGAFYASAIYHEKAPDKHQAYMAATHRGQEVVWLNAGDRIDIDGDSFFEVLAPLKVDETKENNNSLVLMLNTPEGKALFTGDMEGPEETDLLLSGAPLSAQLLKVGHHGEGDASGAPFIAAVSPEIAVISTNSEEEPDTPDPKVLKILQASGAKIYVTQDYELGVRVALVGGHAVYIDP